jgi:hypothetical protein
MTIDISDNDPRISYTANSNGAQTVFAVPFEFFDNSDLKVYVSGVLKSEGTNSANYGVSGGAGSTGTVTFVSGVTASATVVLTRSITIERVTDFTAGADINRAALNTQLDTLTAIAADLKGANERSLSLLDYDDSVSMFLPSKASRLGKILGFNSSTGVPEPRDSAVSSASVSSVTNLSVGVSPTVTVSYVQSTGDIAFAFGLPQGATGNAGSNGIFSSIASKSEAEAGTNTTKGMNPLRVKEAITYNAGNVSNAAFYGFKTDDSRLKVDTTTSGGSEAFTDSDYPQTIMNATGLTFAINTAGHLLLTTP